MTRAIAIGSDTETYLESVPMILRTCRSFARRYGKRDLGELLSEARYHYQLAYAKWDRRKGVGFEHYAHYRIWHGLMETNRTIQRRYFLGRQYELPKVVYAKEYSDFDLQDFILDLRDDAAFVVAMVIEAEPSQFIRYGPVCEPRGYRKVVREMLRERGWDEHRITRAFCEIRRAIK